MSEPSNTTQNNPERRRYLAALARAYYLEERSKVEIAKEFGISRFQVAKHLQEAREIGVVTITIESTRSRDDQGLAAAVGEALGIEAIVVPAPRDDDRRAVMGRAALSYVDRLARPGMRIGVSWSRTLDAAAEFVPALPRCTVIQLAGVLRIDETIRTSALFDRLGHNADVTLRPLYAPFLVTAADTASDLKALPEITDTLDAADQLDLALVAVGAWGPGQSTLWEKCSEQDRDEADAAGAVAEVSGRLFDRGGTAVPTLDDRIIAVSAEQLRRATCTVAVAYGAERAEAVAAAAAAGVVDVAIVDTDLAETLLAGPGAGREA